MSFLVTQVRVIAGASHDRVRVWNRGGLAGELVVTAGDGPDVARRMLFGDDVIEEFDGIDTLTLRVKEAA